jgi:hypothetical protein
LNTQLKKKWRSKNSCLTRRYLIKFKISMLDLVAKQVQSTKEIKRKRNSEVFSFFIEAVKQIKENLIVSKIIRAGV